jgi:hypothetical protein
MRRAPLLLLLACSSAGYAPDRPLILRDVTIAGQPGLIVIIEGDTILGVEHAEGVVPPPNAELIEGEGRELRAAGSPIEAGSRANMVLVDARGRVVITIRDGVIYR